MPEITQHLFETARYVIELAAVPLLAGVTHYLRGIKLLLEKVHSDLLTIEQWRLDHDERDNERFEGVHARVERLEERVDGCQALLHMGRQQHP